jgi:hypothetical protein
LFGDSRERLDTAITRTPHGTSLAGHCTRHGEVRATADERRSYGRFRVERAYDRAPRVPRRLQETSGGVHRITQEKDTHTLRYDWFLSLDGTECEVREAYTGPEGLIEHNRHILDARTKLFKDYADNHFMTVYGEVSEPLLNLLTTHAVGHKWFSFLQGLEPSAVIPPRSLVAAREAKQPV